MPAGLAENPDYQIKRELGRGGMGVVYLAHNVLMGRDEVLKVMGREIMEKPRVFERFQREIRAVAKLRHENIVTAYTAFRIEGGLVFAMEYVEGLDLSRLVKVKGPLSVTHAAYFIHQAALGLQHAHERGTVHRDIKPHNLMLTHNGKARIVKILDFGLAKASREQTVDSSLTNEGQALGTPDYIAPEQILNATDVDIRADLYSLGGTLYFLLTGRPPFRGNSLYDIYQAHISRDADPLNLIRPEVPAELAALVAKLLAKEPRRRFQTPSEVAEALKPFFKKGSAPFQSKPAAPAKPAVAKPAAPAGPKPVRQEPEPPAPAPPPAQPPVSEAGAPWNSLVAISEEAPLVPKTSPRSFLPIKGSRKGPLAVAGVALLSLGILAVLALGLIRVKTPEGTILLEGLPDNAIVEIDDQPVPTITIRKNPQGEPYLTLTPTRHGVRVKTADGKEIVSRDLTIKDGTTEVLHIWQEMTEEDRQAALIDMNQRAWDLATDPDKARRDGLKAVDLATYVCRLDGYKTTLYLDTLAAACAEVGKFEDAVRWQTKAVELHENLTGIDRYRGRLQLYRAGKPYHQGDPLPAPDPLLAETAMTLNDRAWRLATAADPKLRDGKQAVEAATIACEKVNYESPSYLDTLAAALAEAGRFDEAVKRETEAIEKSDSAVSTGKYHARLERYQARTAYHQGDPLPEAEGGGLGAIVPPENLDSLNRQAWELATSPDPARRNGAKAVEMATSLNKSTGHRSSQFLDTLAAACAEAGLFTEAVKWQEEAIKQHGNGSGLDGYRSRLELYKSGKPYRDSSLPPSASGSSRPFVPLFPGKDLAGWTPMGGQGNDWSIDPASGDLVVTGTGDPRKRGFLVSDAEYDNFRLSFQFTSTDSEFDAAIATPCPSRRVQRPRHQPLARQDPPLRPVPHRPAGNPHSGPPRACPRSCIPLDYLPSRSSRRATGTT